MPGLSVAEKTANAKNTGLKLSVQSLGGTLFPMVVLSEPLYGIVEVPEGADATLANIIAERNSRVTAHWAQRSTLATDILRRPKQDPIFELLVRHLTNGLAIAPPIKSTDTEQVLFEVMLSASDILFSSLSSGYVPLPNLIPALTDSNAYGEFWNADGSFKPSPEWSAHYEVTNWADHYSPNQLLGDNSQ